MLRTPPCPQWPLDNLPEQIRSLVDSLGGSVGFLDLTPNLRAETTLGKLPYLVDDTHWSVTGHRAVAEALAICLSNRRPVNVSNMGREKSVSESPAASAR